MAHNERDGTGLMGEGLSPGRAGEADVEGGPECLVPIETHSESAHVLGETEDGGSLAIPWRQHREPVEVLAGGTAGAAGGRPQPSKTSHATGVY